MERRHNLKNINRNRSVFNNLKSKFSRNNVVAPEILVSHVWMQDDETNGVEIIELNSSNDSGSSEGRPATFGQAWNCVENNRFRHADDEYQINKIARERRRLKNNENPFLATYDYNSDNPPPRNGNFTDDVTDFCEAPMSQMNCFTIINNHVINSDSSSEQEYATLGEVETERYNNAYWDHVYSEDRPKYDTSNEKRTIWIYSFKNRPLLSENDFELVNIPGSEMQSLSSSSSTSDDAQRKDNVSATRIGSPIPPTYIPRLNLYLGQTLSTVTEIPELKQSDDSNEAINQSALSSWLTDRREKIYKQANNVINWMALSPRERRRRYKITEVTSDVDNKRETLIYMEGDTEPEITETHKKITSSKVQVDVDVHAVDVENKVPEDIAPKDDTVNNQNDATYVIPKIPEETVRKEIRVSSKTNTPRIKLKTNTKKSGITSPIQNLDTNNWIVEENIEKETKNFNYDENFNKNNVDNLDGRDMNVVSRRLYANSLKFIRASDWNTFLPITSSANSLHLSMSCSSIHEKRTWLQKFKKCFKCCR